MNKLELPYLEKYQYAILVGIICVPFFLGIYLIFYPFLTLAFCAGTILYNYWHKAHYEDIAEIYVPADVTPYQVAAFLYGKNRATQVGIINLLNRDLMAIKGGKRYILKKAGYVQIPEDPNPLIEAWEQASPEKEYTYYSVVKKWYNAEKMLHPNLELINDFLFGARRYGYTIPLWIILITGFIGITAYGGFAGLEWFISVILMAIAVEVNSPRKIIFNKAVERWQAAPNNILLEYAIKGPDAIKKFSDGARLTASFNGEINTGFRLGKSESLQSD